MDNTLLYVVIFFLMIVCISLAYLYKRTVYWYEQRLKTKQDSFDRQLEAKNIDIKWLTNIISANEEQINLNSAQIKYINFICPLEGEHKSDISI